MYDNNINHFDNLFISNLIVHAKMVKIVWFLLQYGDFLACFINFWLTIFTSV